MNYQKLIIMKRDFSYDTLGDSTLIISTDKEDVDVIRHLHLILSEKLKDNIIDFVKTPNSLAVYIDPYKISIKQLYNKINTIVVNESFDGIKKKAKDWKIPICYDPSYAKDITSLSKKLGLSIKKIIELHLRETYKIHMIGFLPGFIYLKGLNNNLKVPRRNTPRKEIKAGSIAIANDQTGIYNVNSPGGWNIIGRTPLSIFNKKKNPPIQMIEGDNVKFYKISKDDYLKLKNNEK